MNIQRNGTQQTFKGPSDWFSGSVRVEMLFTPSGAARTSGASVTFEPGARTNWHTHPIGQTLVVIAGMGHVQCAGGPIETIMPGDVVWIPAGEKHWHGASATHAMTHIAIQEENEQHRSADWFEAVSDEQYAG